VRIAFLFNYPLADNTPWKQHLIRTLRDRHELLVVFGKTRPIDYARAYLRRRQEDDVREAARPVASAEPRRRTATVLKELRVPVLRVRSLNDPACENILNKFKPDFVVTALDHLLARRIINAVPIVLNVHYGVLPEIKGWNATEWSLLVAGRLSVSLHRVVWPVDCGEIYLTRAVEVLPSDDFASLREKCQSVALQLYIEFFLDPETCIRGALAGSAGKTYYVMNRQLKQQVINLIRVGRFSSGEAQRPSRSEKSAGEERIGRDD
jgi:folate-dependent phosphoribosylglycinamide formyltransferase PurN